MEVLVPSSNDAMQMEVLSNGDILFIEFWGPVKRWHANSGRVTLLGRVSANGLTDVCVVGRFDKSDARIKLDRISMMLRAS